MTEVYCDILPHSTGWIFLAAGSNSPAYPSYGLALEAARRYRDAVEDAKTRIVIREQDLRGRMRQVAMAGNGTALRQ